METNEHENAKWVICNVIREISAITIALNELAARFEKGKINDVVKSSIEDMQNVKMELSALVSLINLFGILEKIGEENGLPPLFEKGTNQ